MSILQINHSTLTHHEGSFGDNENNVGWSSGIFFNLKNTSDAPVTINELTFDIGEATFTALAIQKYGNLYYKYVDDTFKLDLEVNLPIELGPGNECRFTGTIVRERPVESIVVVDDFPATGSSGVYVSTTTLKYTQEFSSHIEGSWIA